MPVFCGYGGYCVRLAGHAGVHTRSAMPGTREWDRAREDERVLAGLDFEAPWWADVLDDVD